LIADSVKFRITYEDQQQELHEIEGVFGAGIEGVIKLVSPERYFVAKDTFEKVSKNGSLVERTVFLFSDLLVYGTNNGSEKYSHNRTLHLSLCQVKDIPENQIKNAKHAFQVDSPQKSVILKCHSLEQKEKWKRQISDEIQNCLEARADWLERQNQNLEIPQLFLKFKNSEKTASGPDRRGKDRKITGAKVAESKFEETRSLSQYIGRKVNAPKFFLFPNMETSLNLLSPNNAKPKKICNGEELRGICEKSDA